MEGLINNLLHDIPLPSPGRSVRFWCLGEAVSLSMPKVPQELPLFDYDLLQFFAILGVENAIKLWVCLLLENQILVYSSDFDKVKIVHIDNRIVYIVRYLNFDSKSLPLFE